jgi:hypothetical protein
MMVKWKITGIKEVDETKIAGILQNVHLQIINDTTKQAVKTEVIKKEKGKVSYHTEEEGYYRICVRYHAGWGQSNPQLTMGIKINSDNMDEPDIKSALKTKDLDPVHLKIKELLDSGKLVVEKQKSDLEGEDSAAQLQIKAGRSYYYMTIIQIVVVLAVGVYQVFSFRKFLVSHNVI